jgi:hypothetical protein
MMLISRVRRNGRVDVVIVLSDDNIERIRKYDPAQVEWMQLPDEICHRSPQTIGIAFATADELREIERLSVADADWKEKALKMLSRGFEYRPDLGDHDFGPTVLGKPTPGVKQ